ncbi:MAG: hypothetical protein WHT84_06965, partial [Breznakiellaceae bacterium]
PGAALQQTEAAGLESLGNVAVAEPPAFGTDPFVEVEGVVLGEQDSAAVKGGMGIKKIEIGYRGKDGSFFGVSIERDEKLAKIDYENSRSKAESKRNARLAEDRRKGGYITR